MTLDEPNDADVIFRDDQVTVLGDSRVRQETEGASGLFVDFTADRWGGNGFLIRLTRSARSNFC